MRFHHGLRSIWADGGQQSGGTVRPALTPSDLRTHTVGPTHIVRPTVTLSDLPTHAVRPTHTVRSAVTLSDLPTHAVRPTHTARAAVMLSEAVLVLSDQHGTRCEVSNTTVSGASPLTLG